MTANPIYEELELAIDQIMAGSSTISASKREITELVAIGSDLRHLPRPEFKARLKGELVWQHIDCGEEQRDKGVVPRAKAEFLPTILKKNAAQGIYAIRRSTFAISAGLHAAAAVFIVMLTMWMARTKVVILR